MASISVPAAVIGSMSIPAATVTAGAIGAAAQLGTGIMNANAAGDAAKAQEAQARNALQLQQHEFDTTQANLSPWLQAGQAALPQLQTLLGANGPGAENTAIQALQQNPLYLSQIQQGNQAILANASATGGLRGGNTNAQLAQFNANTMGNTYQQMVQNLMGLSGSGENAAAGLGGFAANYANNASNLMGALGGYQAGGILGPVGAISSGVNGGLSSLFGGISQAGMLNALNNIGWNSPANVNAAVNAGTDTLAATGGYPSLVF